MLNDSNQNSHRVKGHACSFLSLSENHGKPGEKESRKEEEAVGKHGVPLLTSYSTRALEVMVDAHSETEAQAAIWDRCMPG